MKIAQNFTVNSLRVALPAIKFSTPEHCVAHSINETSFCNILNNYLTEVNLSKNYSNNFYSILPNQKIPNIIFMEFLDHSN